MFMVRADGIGNSSVEGLNLGLMSVVNTQVGLRLRVRDRSEEGSKKVYNQMMHTSPSWRNASDLKSLAACAATKLKQT